MSTLNKILWTLIAAFTLFNLWVIADAYADEEPKLLSEYTTEQIARGEHYDPNFVIPSAVYQDPTDWTHDLEEERRLIAYVWRQINAGNKK